MYGGGSGRRNFDRSRRGRKMEKRDDGCGAEGMCLGMSFGLLAGTMLGSHTGIGVSLGMLIGLAIGACIVDTDLCEIC